jgi:glycerol uptake facilitator protein
MTSEDHAAATQQHAAAHAESSPSLGLRCVGEVVGTFVLILFGCGAVHSAVLTGALAGLWQVAIVWGVSIMLACYLVGGLSGAHINPAITVSLAAWGRFAWRDVVPYVLSQVFGAFVAAAFLYLMFSPYLRMREEAKGIVRGEAGSELTAMCYGEYYPNPGDLSTSPGRYSAREHEMFNRLVSHPTAFFAEAVGTLLLALVVFATTDPRNRGGPPDRLAPVFIGLTVAGLITFIAPLTQGCFNPARDFGPRLFASLAGWGSVALPGSQGISFLTVYIAAPIVGAVLGGAIYTLVLRKGVSDEVQRAS